MTTSTERRAYGPTGQPLKQERNIMFYEYKLLNAEGFWIYGVNEKKIEDITEADISEMAKIYDYPVVRIEYFTRY